MLSKLPHEMPLHLNFFFFLNYKNLVKLYSLEQKAKDQLKRLERLMNKLTNYLKNWTKYIIYLKIK